MFADNIGGGIGVEVNVGEAVGIWLAVGVGKAVGVGSASPGIPQEFISRIIPKIKIGMRFLFTLLLFLFSTKFIIQTGGKDLCNLWITGFHIKSYRFTLDIVKQNTILLQEAK